MSLLPKPTLTDYTFLGTPKSRSYFLLSRQKAARDHVKRKWSNHHDAEMTPQQVFNDYKKAHQDKDLFDPNRIEALHQVFEIAISKWTTFRPLFADIMNEYSLVISAFQNILNERRFLLTKIQQLLASIATSTQLKEARLRLLKLRNQLENAQRENESSLLVMSEAEIRFVTHVYMQYEVEMEKINLQKNAKARKDLAVLGKWQFLKDWIAVRRDHDWVMKDLYDSIEKKRKSFRSLIKEEDELKILDSDTAEVRKMKLHIESLRKAHKVHESDLHTMQNKETLLQSQIKMVETKIQNVQELAAMNGIAPSKALLPLGSLRNGSSAGKSGDSLFRI